MALSTLRIISRQSPLAMWQANYIRACLLDLHAGLSVEILGIKTQADRFLDASLASMGGKGAFVKELEQALLSDHADLAVHSMKDVTIDLPDGLSLPVILKREDARDVFISNQYASLAELPAQARVGTSSLRRQCQIKARRPDLQLIDIRGNVDTRLQKLDAGQYDALILAAAGMKRLGFQARIRQTLAASDLLPAIGQGALGLEILSANTTVLELIKPLDDVDTHSCVAAERALSKRLNGGCHAPVAACAEIIGTELSMTALVGRLDGSEILKSSVAGPVSEAQQLGDNLGRELLAMGADAILRELTDGAS